LEARSLAIPIDRSLLRNQTQVTDSPRSDGRGAYRGVQKLEGRNGLRTGALPAAAEEHNPSLWTPKKAQLIKPVVLSKVKLGWVPFGVAAFKVKLDGELTLIVNVTPLVFL
jgi:hypothetical protein